MRSKIIDCITFFNENFIFNLRYNEIREYVDFLVICESKYDHQGNKKKLNFNLEKYSNDKKIKYIILEEPSPKTMIHGKIKLFKENICYTIFHL